MLPHTTGGFGISGGLGPHLKIRCWCLKKRSRLKRRGDGSGARGSVASTLPPFVSIWDISTHPFVSVWDICAHLGHLCTSLCAHPSVPTWDICAHHLCPPGTSVPIPLCPSLRGLHLPDPPGKNPGCNLDPLLEANKFVHNGKFPHIRKEITSAKNSLGSVCIVGLRDCCKTSAEPKGTPFLVLWVWLEFSRKWDTK